MTDTETIADVIVAGIKTALAPVLARLEAIEQRPPFTRALEDHLRDTIGTLREKVAVLEARPLMPGPPGEKGADGKDGEPGTPGLIYQGVFQDGKQYEKGDVTTWAGSTWHCNEETESKPGDGSKAWTLMVKRGRDAK